jgi:hypothetical protein
MAPEDALGVIRMEIRAIVTDSLRLFLGEDPEPAAVEARHDLLNGLALPDRISSLDFADDFLELKVLHEWALEDWRSENDARQKRLPKRQNTR